MILVATDSCLHRDEVAFTLSPVQLDTFGGWKRPAELFDHRSSLLDEGHVPSSCDWDARFFTTPNGPCDLVQDVTTDCSVVAGLSAAINVLTGKHAVRCGTYTEVLTLRSVCTYVKRFFLPSFTRSTIETGGRDTRLRASTSSGSISTAASERSS